MAAGLRVEGVRTCPVRSSLLRDAEGRGSGERVVAGRVAEEQKEGVAEELLVDRLGPHDPFLEQTPDRGADELRCLRSAQGQGNAVS